MPHRRRCQRYDAPSDELREHGRRCFDRGGLDTAAVQRQTAAIAAAGERRAVLATLSAPTLVIHGEDDPLIGVEAGQATAAAIPSARLIAISGPGPRPAARAGPRIAAEIAALTGTRGGSQR